MDRLWRLRRHVARSLDEEGRCCQVAIERDGQIRVAQLVSLDCALQGCQDDPGGVARAIRARGKRRGALLHHHVKA